MAKPERPKLPAAVRTRRAYFDCRFGQLHVRTAFPTTGGFDEETTLFCVHGAAQSGRVYDRVLPLLGTTRSAYAADLPGSGESDAPPPGTPAAAAAALADLARDLRLRQIDVLAVREGANVAVELAGTQPELVRRLVLLDPPAAATAPRLKQPVNILKSRPSGAPTGLSDARSIDIGDSADPLQDAPQRLADELRRLLAGR